MRVDTPASTGRHLVADLGGVTFHFDHPRRLHRLAQICGHSTEQIHALLWESGFSADCDRGRYDTAAQVRSQIRAALTLTCSDDDLDDAWCSAFRPDPRVVDVLDRHRAGRPLALFTNNGPLEEEALAQRYPEVFHRFARTFFTHRLGRRKPEPDAFAAVAAGLGLPGDQIVFVDDSPANVAAARLAGWRAIRFTDVPNLRAALGEALA